MDLAPDLGGVKRRHGNDYQSTGVGLSSMRMRAASIVRRTMATWF